MYSTCRSIKLLALLAGYLWLGSTVAFAQARKTATRSDEFDAFGAFTLLDNNYTSPRGNYGGTLGGDYTHFIRRYRGLIIPSIQVRGSFAPGPAVGEKTLQGGLRLATTYRQFHPYGEFLVGDGILTFTHPRTMTDGRLYRRDSSFIYVYGGGFTYDIPGRGLVSEFSLLADYQRQDWNLGERPPVRFNPQALSFGVVFHIPFKAYRTR